MSLYKVAIIGAGSIGANKPDKIDSPVTENILTHCHAASYHHGFELQAIVDNNKEQLSKAITKWQPKSAFNTIEEMFNDPTTMDVIVIAVPTEFHFEILNKIKSQPYDKRPSLVICEKPFCSNKEQAIYFLNQPVLINYIRRFDSGHQQIKQWIDEEKFGKVQNCRVLYGRGLKHDGSHAIDLMHWFFGECRKAIPFAGRCLSDRDSNDPSVSVIASFEKCPDVVFQPCDGRQYGIFEIDILLEQARIRLIDNGLYYEMYPINKENEWGHASLSYKLTEVVRKETQLQFAMYNLYENAFQFLEGEKKLLCTVQDAIKVHEFIE